MYDHILVPLKGDATDGPIVAHAGAVARMSGGTLILLRVVHAHTRDEFTFLEGEAHTYLDKQAAALKADRVQADTKVMQGEPAPAIVAAARDGHAELIVMATHGHREVRHVLVGSVTEDVLRSSTTPVLLVRP
jgi:nucleotide-binding universal stress UspA family protein